MQLTRAKEILMHQEMEWSRFVAEESESQALIRYGFVFIILSCVAEFIGASYYGFGWFNYHLSMSVISAAIQVASLYYLPVLLARLAPNFGGAEDKLSAQKLYVFAMTPVWVGSLFLLIPKVGGLFAFAGSLFTLYLFWKHIGEAMRVPSERLMGYVITCLVIIIAVAIITGMVSGSIASSLFGGPSFNNMNPFG